MHCQLVAIIVAISLIITYSTEINMIIMYGCDYINKYLKIIILSKSGGVDYNNGISQFSVKETTKNLKLSTLLSN